MIRDQFHQQRHYLGAAAVLAAVYVVLVVLISPQHEFPLNDDWAYAQTVRHLLNTGELRISEWASATTILQTYAGGLAAMLSGGFSFTALRVTTLIFSLIGSLALYDLLLQLGISKGAALLGVMALIANPLYIYLSYTFMSDVYYFALMLLSLAWYVRGIQHDQVWALLLGSIFAAAAYLSRQLGLVLPVAALMALLLKYRRWSWRSTLSIAAFPVLVFVTHTLWLRYIHGLPWGMETAAIGATLNSLRQPKVLVDIAWRLLFGLMYIGLFTLPLFVAQSLSLKFDRTRLRRLVKIYGLWLIVLGLPAIAMALSTGRYMPYLANTINREGIGTLTLLGHKTPITPSWVFLLVTVLAPFAGAAQGTLWTEGVLNARRESRGPGATLFIASLIMAVPTCLIVFLWDEYLLVFIPLGAYVLLRLGALTRRGWLIGLCTCGAMFSFSLIEMGDYFAWNAARWEAGEALLARGVPPEAIDGGFEWTGWYEFESALPRAIAAGKGNDLTAWMTLTPKRYILAYEPLPNYNVIDQIPYHIPLLGEIRYLYVLEQP